MVSAADMGLRHRNAWNLDLKIAHAKITVAVVGKNGIKEEHAAQVDHGHLPKLLWCLYRWRSMQSAKVVPTVIGYSAGVACASAGSISGSHGRGNIRLALRGSVS